MPLHLKATRLKAYKWWSERKISSPIHLLLLVAYLVGVGSGFYLSLPKNGEAAIAQSNVTWDEHKVEYSYIRSWRTITSSADGTKLAAGVDSGYIYTSTDSGVTWTEQTGSGARAWRSIASSADGTKLAAGVGGGYIYTSADSGVTWTPQTGSGSRAWGSIASSADGTKLVGAVDNGYIYTSTDSGINWTQQSTAGLREWRSITSSADGTKLAVGVNGSYIYTSTDSGATWNTRTGSGSRGWKSVTSSADGTKLAASVFGGYIYTSTDSGVTWTEQTGSGARAWRSIATSADGTKLAGVVYGVSGGYIYTSTDSGVTWTEQTGSGARKWYFISSSADGTKLAAVLESGNIYVSHDSGVNWDASVEVKMRYWGSIASSADGTKLAAMNYSGYIYTSTDSGSTWTEQTASGSREGWRSITSSADGTKLAAVNYSGYIYTSADSGVTWIERTGSGLRWWFSIASSADGTKLAAVANSSYIYTSTDGGATWNEQTGAGSRYWRSIASSADGTKLAAANYDGYIYTSTDGGATWNEQTGAGSRVWESITSSADGTKLAAAVYGGYIYTSTDSGVTWTPQTGAGSGYWRSITSSADGTKLAVVYITGYIYTSTDSGVTWIEQVGSGSRDWYSIASSADGTKLVAVVNNGFIYTSTIDFTLPVFENLPGQSVNINLTEGQEINDAPYPVLVKPTDIAGIQKVEIYNDGSLVETLEEADVDGVYNFNNSNWPTAEGTLVTVRAYDNAGNTTDLSVTVQHTSLPVFENLPGQSVNINLTEGQIIRTAPTIRVKPTDPAGIAQVEYYVDNSLKSTIYSGEENPESGVFESSIPLTNKEDGVDIKVIAYDSAGLSSEISRHIVPDPWYFPYGTSFTDPTSIPDGGSRQGSPSVYGNDIVFEDNRTGTNSIYLYNSNTGQEKQLSQDGSSVYAPQISGNKVVWEDYSGDYGDIYAYDLHTELTQKISTDPDGLWDQYYVDISGDYAVWEDYRNDCQDCYQNADIYLYDLATNTEYQITNAPGYESEPRIWGNKIVWWDERNNGLYYADITNITSLPEQVPISITDGSVNSYDIYQNKIVWNYHNGENYQIDSYDLETGLNTEITEYTEGYNPLGRISYYDNYIVWGAVFYEDDGITTQVYLYDSNSSEVLTVLTSKNSGFYKYQLPYNGSFLSDRLLVFMNQESSDYNSRRVNYLLLPSFENPVDIYSPESIVLAANTESSLAPISVSAWDNVEATRAEISIDITNFVDLTKGTVTPSPGNIGATTSFSLTKSLPNKLFMPYTLKVYDAAGNVATKMGNIVVNDSEAPKVTNVEPLAGTTGEVTELKITATDNAEVAKLQVSVNGAKYVDAVESTYSLNVPVDSVADIKIKVKAFDGAGNSAESEEYLVEVTDNDPPKITDFTAPAEITVEESTVSVLATDNIAPTRATISFDDETWVDMQGAKSPFTYNVGTENLSNGDELKYAIRVYDAAGNYATTEEGKSSFVVSEEEPEEESAGVIQKISQFIQNVYKEAKNYVIKVAGAAAEVIKKTPPPVAHSFPYVLFAVLGFFAWRLAVSAREEAAQSAKMLEIIRIEKVIAEDKENFIALSSHYLRTPLTILKGGLDTTTASKSVQNRLSNAIATMEIEIKRILKSIENNKYLVDIKKPNIKRAKIKAYGSLLIWLPLLAIGGLAVLANFVFINLQVIETETLNLVIQGIIFVTMAQYFFSVYRKKHNEKQNLENLEQTMDYEQRMDSARNLFIEQTTNNLSGKLKTVATTVKNVKDESRETLTEGLDRFKAIFLKLALLKDIKAGAKVDDKKSLVVSQLLTNIIQSKKADIKAKNISIDKSGSLGTIHQNQELVSFVLGTVIDNAIKFSSKEGKVSINYTGYKGLAKFVITDNGQGISKEGMMHLFKPFTRTSSAMHFDYEGFGFSLFLAKIVAEHLGGDIQIKSQKGKGTTATILFEM